MVGSTRTGKGSLFLDGWLGLEPDRDAQTETICRDYLAALLGVSAMEKLPSIRALQRKTSPPLRRVCYMGIPFHAMMSTTRQLSAAKDAYMACWYIPHRARVLPAVLATGL